MAIIYRIADAANNDSPGIKGESLNCIFMVKATYTEGYQFHRAAL